MVVHATTYCWIFAIEVDLGHVLSKCQDNYLCYYMYLGILFNKFLVYYQAYREWMSGTLQFELKHWHEAMELLTKAKLIYEKMSSALTGDAVLIYKQKVTDIEPSVR